MSANQSAKGFCIAAGGPPWDPPWDPKAVLAKQFLISLENSNALAGTLKHLKLSEVQGPLQPRPHRPCYLFKQQVVPSSPLFVSVASSTVKGDFPIQSIGPRGPCFPGWRLMETKTHICNMCQKIVIFCLFSVAGVMVQQL